MTAVRVTADHVRRGQRRAPCLCPLALAIEDALPGSKPLACGRWAWLWSPDGRRLRHDLTAGVAGRVRLYDETGEMDEYEFALGEGA